MATVTDTKNLPSVQEGDQVNLGAAGTYTKTPDGSYEPVVLSTAQAQTDVANGNSTIAKLSGTPVNSNADPNSTNPGKNIQYDPSNPYNLGADGKPLTGTGNFGNSSMPSGPTAPAGTGSGAAPASAGSVTFVNPDTDQTQKLDVGSITPDVLKNLLGQGYQVGESVGAIPGWISAGDPATGQANADLADLQKQFQDLKNGLSQFTISDADLQSQVQAISGQWDARIADMQDTNARRDKTIATLGVRLGSQYTGGKGGVFGGIISEEERQGVQRIADLESQKQAAIAAAKEAARTKNWDVYNTQVGLAEDAYKDKLAEVQKLNQSVSDANKAAQDAKIQASRQGTIADLIGQGVTDPAQLINYLNYDDSGKQTGDFTIKEVTDALKSLLPQGLDDIAKSAAKNGASPDVIKGILGASSVADAYAAAGDYLAEGTGIVGEYQYYVRQAKANGQTPVDFNTYQTQDANRKAKATGTGSNPNRLLSVSEALALGVPFGTSAAGAFGVTPQKPATDAQNQASGFATRAVQSGADISNLEGDVTKLDPLTYSIWNTVEGNGIANALLPGYFKQFKQAARNFETAVLRRESGAAISATEFATDEKKYFPSPGDDVKTLQQKAQARAAAIQSLVKSSGSAYQPPVGDQIIEDEQAASAKVASWVGEADSNLQQYQDLLNDNPSLSDSDVAQILGIQ